MYRQGDVGLSAETAAGENFILLLYIALIAILYSEKVPTKLSVIHECTNGYLLIFHELPRMNPNLRFTPKWGEPKQLLEVTFKSQLRKLQGSAEWFARIGVPQVMSSGVNRIGANLSAPSEAL